MAKIKLYNEYLLESLKEQYKTESITYGDVKVGDVIIDSYTDNSGKKNEYLSRREPDDAHQGRHIVFEEVDGTPGKWSGNGKFHRISEAEWDKMSHKLVERLR